MENVLSEKKYKVDMKITGMVILVLFFLFILAYPSTLLTAVFYLCLAVYTVFYPKWALALLIVYFPARSFITETNTALKLFAEVTLVSSVFHVFYQARKNIKSIFSFQWFELLFFLFCVIGAVAAHITGVSIGAIITEVRAFVLTYLVYYVGKRLTFDEKDMQLYAWFTFGVAILLSLLGIIEKISNKEWLFPSSWSSLADDPTNGPRVYGLTKNPNVLASFLIIAFFISHYVKSMLSGWKKWAVFVGMIMMGVTFILTYSRGTVLAFVFALLVYIVYKRNIKQVVQFVMTFAVSAVMVFAVVNPFTNHLDIHSSSSNVNVKGIHKQTDQTKNRILKTFSSDTMNASSSDGRLFIVHKGLSILKDHPVAGSGFATFGDSASLIYPSPVYSKYQITGQIYSDDQYIQIIAETGAIGTLVFAAFTVFTLLFTWKNRKGTIQLFTLLLFLAMVASGFVYNIWEDKTSTFYFFGLLGIVYSQSKKERS